MNKIALSTFLLILFSVEAFSQITLPKLISDGMVLQREADVKIWGWAEEGKALQISFLDSTYTVKADHSGEWSIMLSSLEAGGPYSMQISADSTITIEDILIGDVWVASGQSNMELPMRRVKPLYEDVISRADYPHIRYFDVPKRYDFNEERKDLESGHWQTAAPESVEQFSAAAWFFAKSLYQKNEIPVGIILSALGGSPAEAWISEEALKKFPEHYHEAQRFKDSTLIGQIELNDRERIGSWYHDLQERDLGYENPDQPWHYPATDYSGWETMKVPGYWADEPTGRVNGVVWFQKEIFIPEDKAGKPANLEMGRVVDADSVFINGHFVGETSYQYPPRWYRVPEGVLKAGKNNLVVRVINERGNGGFIPDKPYELIVERDTIDLKGNWNYRVGTGMEPLESQTFIRWKPTGLFNAMISPLLNYRIKGVIWYQGESNTGRPEEYRELFPLLINDWRSRWRQGDFPFLFVQLANYMEPADHPDESNWALLREAQLKSLTVPNTGMAVTIDIGEWNDIHPLNKKDVGARLAATACKVAYGEDVVHSGPVYESMKVDGNKIILSFRNTGSGLTVRGDTLHEFAIAGRDQSFQWAKARIEGENVIVWNENVKNPVSVRYAWADNPENANLYNMEGFPASPFRTDELEDASVQIKTIE